MSQDKKTILVVEDNPVESLLVRKILTNAGFNTIAIDRGKQVLDTVIKEKPDLILLDAMLPDIDGFHICKTIRRHPKGIFVPIIMLTGLNDVESIDTAYEAGATDFFTKPINHSLLVHRIRYHLRGRNVMDQLRMSQQSLASAQQVAKLGNWELALNKKKFTLSEEVHRIYEFDPKLDVSDASILMSNCHADDLAALKEAFKEAIEKKKEVYKEHRIILKDGSIRYVAIHIKPVNEESDTEPRILGISMDITERKKSEQEILRTAYFDRLTNLPSRPLLEQFIDHRENEDDSDCMAILGIDLDLFNRVNSTMGHAAGDAVLEQLAERLRQLIKFPSPDDLIKRLSVSANMFDQDERNIVARLGADTFIIVLTGLGKSSKQPTILAENIQQALEKPFHYQGKELFVTASIGIASSEVKDASTESLLQRVDMALHEAKHQGRNNIRKYHESLANKVSSHLAIQSDLSKALKNNEFLLCYQAKISNTDNQVSGFEALLRWNHPERGWVSPYDFIQIAEETGQIVEIGAWVMENACRQNKIWLEEGLVDVKVAVNITSRQLRENDFVDMVKQTLKKTGLSPDRLELEMTESTLMADPQTEAKLKELREFGISIALDDFGTGYSSLSYITQFPIDTIKIDRCFIKDIATNSNKAAIVSAVTNLSHKLSFNVIAEGVETERELGIIQELQCDEVQGFLYSEPAVAEDMGHWLKLKREPLKKKSGTSNS